MDKVVVAEIGVKGGGVTIYGRQRDGVWSLWRGGRRWTRTRTTTRCGGLTDSSSTDSIDPCSLSSSYPF
jgi:hypothetical protein